MDNNIKIIHSSRARHLRISVSPDKQVSLIIPRWVSEREGMRFLNSKIDWIEKTLTKIKPKKTGKWEYKFSGGEIVFFFGLPHHLQFHENITYPNINTNHKLIITPPKKKIFENFLSNRLREHIYSFAFKFCKENDFAFCDLKIKNIVSRWGSCSRLGNMNFSVRLIHYEKEVINYVVIHELCHTKEMNHSHRFWGLVAQYCPNFKTYIKMLK